MIEQHLDVIEKEFAALMKVSVALGDTDPVFGLISQQRAVIRREMAAYALEALRDSAAAQEAQDICDATAVCLKPSPMLKEKVRTVCNTCGRRGTDDMVGSSCTSCNGGTWIAQPTEKIADLNDKANPEEDLRYRLNDKERAKGRSEGYWRMSVEDQWAEDKRLGILDWDGK